jgi:hypothetical protein
LTLSAASSVRADAAVLPVLGTNLSDGEVAAIGSLIASAYAFQTGKPVLPPAEVGPVLETAGSERAAIAQLGVAEYVRVEAVRLNTRIALVVSLRNRHGSSLFELRTTATSLDDMEVVSERIAASLARRTPLQHTRTIGTVIGREAQAPNRLFLEKIFGARVAGTYILARHLEKRAALSLMFDGRLETADYFLEFGAGFLISSPSNQDSASLGALLMQLGGSYYLGHGSVSPYVGIGVSPRIAFGDYEGIGFTANGQLGVMFLREASTRFYLELRVDQNLMPLEPRFNDYTYVDGVPVIDHRGKVLPTELSVAAGIGW